MGVKRFSISIEEPLLEKFDQFIEKEGYSNRSEAIRDLMRLKFAEEMVEKDAECFGTLTLIYDHHQSGLVERLLNIQHEYGGHILVTLHHHITHNLCLEVLLLRGKGSDIRSIGNKLKALKGVKLAKLAFLPVLE